LQVYELEVLATISHLDCFPTWRKAYNLVKLIVSVLGSYGQDSLSYGVEYFEEKDKKMGVI